MANKLKDQTSPYLLQHAENPVYWYPWGEEALNAARESNKLILVSIGYSACHWCHVMEHESFEDEQVAQLMNENFICIKIDREERPDIDQIYMTAAQLMTGRGGWPLNCFCLPDQRPIYGGTYFPKQDWMNLLLNLADFWKEKPEEAEEYAVKLTEGIRQSEQLIPVASQQNFDIQHLLEIYKPWKRSFDMSEGGYNRAPKFPLPNNWQFLLRYAHHLKDDSAHTAVRLTLQKMAFGGIYDQIGGGFARYSVDDRWHVPHFEKMLYDNAQLISLYSEAFQYTPDQLYKDVVYETVDFIIRELKSPDGGFYSALDADSEGVEGKFYTYSKKELQDILGKEEELFSIYFNVTESGNWEEEHTNIFYRNEEDEVLAQKLGMAKSELKVKISEAKKTVLLARGKRIRPGLDNKILAAWNGLMLKACTDAYRAFNDSKFIDLAIQNAEFIEKYLIADGEILRIPDSGNIPRLSGFLDDYAFVIDGLIGLYESNFDEKWLYLAKKLSGLAIQNFFDEESGLFFYTSINSEALIARKQEILDNVIPSSNSAMALNLLRLSHFFNNDDYEKIASRMLNTVQPHIKSYSSGYSNWANLLLLHVFGVNEIAITGPDNDERRAEIEQQYIPNKIVLGGTSGTLPLLQDRFSTDTLIYLCKNRTCSLPVKQVNDLINLIDNPSTTP